MFDRGCCDSLCGNLESFDVYPFCSTPDVDSVVTTLLTLGFKHTARVGFPTKVTLL